MNFSSLMSSLISRLHWLFTQIGTLASNVRDIIAALSHIQLTWLIRPVIAAVVIVVLVRIIKKARK